jgi:hypothetical protein
MSNLVKGEHVAEIADSKSACEAESMSGRDELLLIRR